jgi:pyridoxal phosphate enzyme (YggS family)
MGRYNMNLKVEDRTELIQLSTRKLLDTIPSSVIVVAAAKGRMLPEVRALIQAGITHIGHNYVQEAQPMIETLGDQATWHMIGHLQRNKAKKAAHLFDVIETVDSFRLAQAIDHRCVAIDKVIPILVEINSGREPSKTGVLPEDVDAFVLSLESFEHINVQGLMTMGPRFGDPEGARPYFRATRQAFERLSTCNLPHMDLQYLSMGMSNSYLVAIEEGANIVRIGTKLFESPTITQNKYLENTHENQ